MNTHAFLTHYHFLNRADFIPEPFKCEASLDSALPIGYGQTISQPSMVVQMSLILDPEPNNTVLEIGTGSGYQAALLAPFCRSLFTIERIEELSHQAQKRFQELGLFNIQCRIGDGNLGWPEKAPFDRIIVTAAANQVPPSFIEQLAPGGRLLIPVGNPLHQRLLCVEKDLNGTLSTSDKGAVVFVELVGPYGWSSRS